MKYLHVFLWCCYVVFCSCSGNGGKPQDADTANVSADTPLAKDENTEKPVDFNFSIDGNNYKADNTSVSYYAIESDTSSLLYLRGDLKKDSSEVLLSIILRTPKNALKPGDYMIVDANNDALRSPCKVTYTNSGKIGKVNMGGYSTKGTLTVTDYKVDGNNEGYISGSFSCEGMAVVTDAADEPQKIPTTMKGQFKEVKLGVVKR